MGMFEAFIVAKNKTDARKLDEMGLDLHRRGTRKESSHRYLVPGLLTGEQIDEVKRAAFEVIVVDDITTVLEQRRAEVSRTNRFARILRAEEMLPVGFEGYMNVEEIETALTNLSSQHPEMAKLIELPNHTWENSVSHAVRLGTGSDEDRVGVMFTGSMHAREWGGSDICVSFMNNLVNAYESKLPIQFGTRIYSPDLIKLIMEKLWIYVFPDVNPDGKKYSQTHDDPADASPEKIYYWWRKNRNPNHNDHVRKQGVDINRNFDFLWNESEGASTILTAPDYKGTGAFSEPETRNVKYLFDTYPEIKYCVDIHSWTGLILCAWGNDENQSIDPSMSFLNPAYDGQRGWENDSYKEFIPPADDILSLGIADRMNKALGAVRGTQYMVQQGIELYATIGTSSDYAYSRHLADPSRSQIIGFTIEFSKKGFIPEFDEMKQIIKEINSAMLELCWIACADVLRP